MRDLKETMEMVQNGEMELTDEMECQGDSPWVNNNVPTGIWAWSSDQNAVLIGTCSDELEILTYQEAIREYPENAVHYSMIDELLYKDNK